MPKVKISEYSATANSNTDVASINIDEGCAPSGINNAIRAIMGHLKDFQQGTYGDPFNGPVNGTVGATTPSTGAFTTLSSTVTGASAITSTVDTGWAFLDGKTSGGGDRLLIQGYSAGTGTKLASYNSSLGAFAPIKIAGSQVLLAPSDTTVATVNAFGN